MFQVGDRVVALAENGLVQEGTAGTVHIGYSESPYIKFDNGESWYIKENYLKLISNQPFMSSLTQKVAQLFLSEPEKSFQKVGIIDASNQLTSDGKEVFLNWLLKTNKDAFNTEVVQPLVAAEAAEKKA